MSLKVAAALLPVGLVLFLATGFEYGKTSTDVVGVNVDALPPLAQELLPMVESERLNACPEIPLIWLLAHVQAESSWNPRAYSSAGAAGLLQFMPGTWTEAGGGDGWASADWPGGRPPGLGPAHAPAGRPAVDVRQPARDDRPHRGHRQARCTSGGDGRVPHRGLLARHRLGLRYPRRGGGWLRRGLRVRGARVHRHHPPLHRGLGRARLAARLQRGGAAPPFNGGSTGCVVPDPTGTGGCVTAATAWMLTQSQAAFPDIPVACYRPATWGEHGLGRACDFVIGRIGAYPGPGLTQRGWQFARWLQDNAAPLNIQYLIWQGRIWSVARNAEGWRVYNGAGGLVDTTEPTGGHYDHVHVSVTR